MPNKYWAIVRPMYDAIPRDNFAACEHKYPPEKVTTSAGVDIYTYGWVEYAAPLTFDQLYHYTLLPDDPLEYAHYEFWLYADRDHEYAMFFEQDFVEQIKSGAIVMEDVPEQIQLALKILLEDRKPKSQESQLALFLEDKYDLRCECGDD